MTALLTSQANIIQTYIIGQGLMSTPSDGDVWPLYVSHLPDIDIDCGAIYDTAGVLDAKLSNGEVVEHLGIQISIRSDDYEMGYIKIEAITLALDVIHNVDVALDSATYYRIQNASRSSPIVPLGTEKGTKRRFLFTVNFLMTLRKIT